MITTIQKLEFAEHPAGQWIIGINDIHAGYVQKRNGNIHFVERVTPEVKAEVIRRVNEQFGFNKTDAGTLPPEIEEDEDESQG